MLFVLVWVIVGGTRTIAGPIVGVVVLTVVDQGLRSLEEWRPLFYGAILILTVMFLPQGLESLPRRAKAVVGIGAARASPADQRRRRTTGVR